MFKKTTLFLIICFSFAIAGSSGCGGSENDVYQPPEEINDPETFDNYKLTLIGWQSINLTSGQQVSLQVQYTNNDQPLFNEPIQFAFKEIPGDSYLNSNTVYTHQNGFAENKLTAGQLPVTFRVEARAPKAGPVEWTIFVQSQQPPVDPNKTFTGTFNVTSNFDIQSDFTGSNLADVLNMLNELSDDPEDPGKFVVDRVLEQVDDEALQTVASLFKSALYQQVNLLLFNTAPDLITDIKQLAANLSAIARKFQMRSQIAAKMDQHSNQLMIVDHTLNSLGWTLNGQTAEYSFTQIGMNEPKVENVKMSINVANNHQLTINEHSFKLSYGAFLLVALNNLVIPQLLHGANSVEDLLLANINCTSVGQTINGTVSIGSNSLWAAACEAGMKILGDLVNSKISELGSGDTLLTLKGTAILRDMNHDGYFDDMNQGHWSGSFSLDSCEAPIYDTSTSFWGVPALTQSF